jgi:hypothetical protein
MSTNIIELNEVSGFQNTSNRKPLKFAYDPYSEQNVVWPSKSSDTRSDVVRYSKPTPTRFEVSKDGTLIRTDLENGQAVRKTSTTPDDVIICEELNTGRASDPLTYLSVGSYFREINEFIKQGVLTKVKDAPEAAPP